MSRSIDLEYIDPRPEERKDTDAKIKEVEQDAAEARKEAWLAEVESAKAAALPEPEEPEMVVTSTVRPDWEKSPIEVSHDAHDETEEELTSE